MYQGMSKTDTQLAGYEVTQIIPNAIPKTLYIMNTKKKEKDNN